MKAPRSSEPPWQALRRAGTFGDVPDDVLARIAALARWQSRAKGEVLFHEGEPVAAVYLLGGGRVKVWTVTGDGREQLLHLLEPGAVFPRVGLFTGSAYPATAVMDEAGTVGILAKDAVLDLVRRDGEVAVALLTMMEGVVRALQERVRSLALQDVKSRVLQLLMRETGRELTHQEIAAFVGAARETVSRAVAELRRQGIALPSRRGHGRAGGRGKADGPTGGSNRP
ncbi:MAG TPA: Crp/Fnr family transcriptional regulator [Bacillota bacterium]